MTRDKARLTVKLDQQWHGVLRSVEILIDGPFLEAFDPVDVCSDFTLAALLGKHDDETVKVVRKKREDYASYLAKELAAAIVTAMEAEDTRNGYREVATQ